MKSLPRTFLNLVKTIETIDLSGNPLNELSDEDTLGWRDIKKFFGSKASISQEEPVSIKE